jgi:hypothetical protein
MKKKSNWIQGAVKKPGALTAQAGRVKKSPMAFARQKAHAPGITGQRARFALNMKKIAARHKGRQHRR